MGSIQSQESNQALPLGNPKPRYNRSRASQIQKANRTFLWAAQLRGRLGLYGTTLASIQLNQVLDQLNPSLKQILDISWKNKEHIKRRKGILED